jgi:hypothetical protein
MKALAQDGEQWMNYLDKYSESVQWLMKLTLGFLMNAAPDNLPTAVYPDHTKCTRSWVFFAGLFTAGYIFLHLLFLNFSALKYSRSVGDCH